MKWKHTEKPWLWFTPRRGMRTCIDLIRAHQRIFSFVLDVLKLPDLNRLLGHWSARELVQEAPIMSHFVWRNTDSTEK